MKPIAIALLTTVLLGLAACSDVEEDTRPGQPVKTRQAAFKDLLRSFEPMGKMFRTGPYDAARFATLATELATKRDAPWSHFGTDTNYPPTKARPEVWSQAVEFERERQAFLTATDALLTVTRQGSPAEVEKAYFRVYDRCESCHQHFKRK